MKNLKHLIMATHKVQIGSDSLNTVLFGKPKVGRTLLEDTADELIMVIVDSIETDSEYARDRLTDEVVRLVTDSSEAYENKVDAFLDKWADKIK